MLSGQLPTWNRRPAFRFGTTPRCVAPPVRSAAKPLRFASEGATQRAPRGNEDWSCSANSYGDVRARVLCWKKRKKLMPDAFEPMKNQRNMPAYENHCLRRIRVRPGSRGHPSLLFGILMAVCWTIHVDSASEKFRRPHHRDFKSRAGNYCDVGQKRSLELAFGGPGKPESVRDKCVILSHVCLRWWTISPSDETSGGAV
jgi:hypothetical protein